MTKVISGAIGIALFAAVACLGVSAQQNQMSFFITSAGPGNGANLGGLAGADKPCQTLAAAAGAKSVADLHSDANTLGAREAARSRISAPQADTDASTASRTDVT